MYALYHMYMLIRGPVDLLPRPSLRANDSTPGTIQFLKLRDSNECAWYSGIYKRKKEITSLFLALNTCSQSGSATGAANARRKFLITILSVSKRNRPQPPPSHIKPITFGNELRTHDMIPKGKV